MARNYSWKREWKKRFRKISMSKSGYRRIPREKLLRTIAFVSLIGVAASFFVFLIMFAWYARDLPNPDGVVRREGFATKIVDRNGEQLWDVFSDQKRIPVKLEQIPLELRQAVISIEDKDFYKHEGFDPKGMLRGFSRIIFQGRIQGGSTLTQQLVKNVLLTSERTITRKLKEFILAIQIERKFSKDQILVMYLNEAPFGGTAWGVEAASEVYFDKPVEELTLVESAVLAGLPQRPTAYSPFGANSDAYMGRTKDVLRRMREEGYISREQEKQAVEKLENLEFSQIDTGIRAPHFVMFVQEQLSEMYGERMVEQGGLKVTTTLDYEIQEAAQKIVSEEIEKVEGIDITNGAALVMDPKTGEVLSMVGSKGFFAEDYDGQVNVTLSLRQPGSSIKPVTYATAFAKGYSPAYPIMDVRTEFPGRTEAEPYIPVNYDGEYHGPLALRRALASSINVPAVKLLQIVGVEEMLTMANNLGFTSLAPTRENMSRLGLSVTLGGGEVRLIDMVSAYSAFSNGGKRVDPVTILKVEDREGKVLFEHKSVDGQRVISEEVAFLMNDILSDNNARLITFGANSLINISGRPIAVKTGTTNDQRDNWTVGWTNGTAVVGVWVGNNDNSPMKQVASGVSGAAPIWRKIFLEVLETRESSPFSQPGGVEQHQVDSVSGFPEHDGFPGHGEYFINGTLPSGEDRIHEKLKICGSSGKLANQAQIASGNYEEKEYFVFEAPEILASGTQEDWMKGIEEWANSQGDDRYRPPKELCEGSEEMVVRVNSPHNEQNLTTNDVEINVEVFSDSPVEWVKVVVDEKIVDTLNSGPFRTTLFLDDGAYKIRFRARNSAGREAESGDVRIGVNVAWDKADPTPTLVPTLIPTPSPTPTP